MSPERSRSFATLTHARLRAAQGDFGGAARILRVILEVQPEHDEARVLLAEIEGRKAVAHSETQDGPVDAVTSATSGDLARRFRDTLGADDSRASVRLLSAWRETVQRNRGARRDQ